MKNLPSVNDLNEHFSLRLISLFLLLGLATGLAAQKESKTNLFTDSLDHAFDLSDWVIDARGFVPVPTLITEPALGGIGGALGGVFLEKKKLPGGISGPPSGLYVPPDITAGIGSYTANGTWGVGVGRIGNFLKQRLRYRAVAGYFDINLSFFRQILGQEIEFKFNFETPMVHFSALRQVGRSKWYVGLQYLFIHTKVVLRDRELPDFIPKKELKSIISTPGAVIEFDNRDNFFTPNRGSMLHLHANWSNQVFGSDFNNLKLNFFFLQYLQFADPWVGGFRLETSAAFGELPFYMLPFVNLRGVPIARYQGDLVLTLETEQRLRVYRRWSALLFGGVGKPFNYNNENVESSLAYNAGVGWRYLVARKFGLHMGLDVALGPESWGFYVVFGSAWNR